MESLKKIGMIKTVYERKIASPSRVRLRIGGLDWGCDLDENHAWEICHHRQPEILHCKYFMCLPSNKAVDLHSRSTQSSLKYQNGVHY